MLFFCQLTDISSDKNKQAFANFGWKGRVIALKSQKKHKLIRLVNLRRILQITLIILTVTLLLHIFDLFLRLHRQRGGRVAPHLHQGVQVRYHVAAGAFGCSHRSHSDCPHRPVPCKYIVC